MYEMGVKRLVWYWFVLVLSLAQCRLDIETPCRRRAS